MDREQIDPRLDQRVAPRLQPLVQLRAVGLDLLDQHDRAAALDHLRATFQSLELHPLDVDLDQVDARQAELVERQLADVDHVLIVDGLADELVVAALAQLQAAETGGHEVVRIRDLHDPAFGRHGAMHRERVEAVVDGDVAGQRIVDALLRLDREHGSPARHHLRPFDGVHADIGAAIDTDDAVAVMLAAQREQVERELDLAGIEARGFQDLEADAIAPVLIDHPVVEPVHDQGAVIG